MTGGTLVEAVAGHPVWDADVITPREKPLQEDAGIAVLRGNLAPRGAIVKPAAASPELLVHRGPAVVFDSVEDLHARIDDPALPSHRTRCWCSAAAVRRGTRACPRWRTCRCRGRCSNWVSATWCGCATGG